MLEISYKIWPSELTYEDRPCSYTLIIADVHQQWWSFIPSFYFRSCVTHSDINKLYFTCWWSHTLPAKEDSLQNNNHKRCSSKSSHYVVMQRLTSSTNMVPSYPRCTVKEFCCRCGHFKVVIVFVLCYSIRALITIANISCDDDIVMPNQSTQPSLKFQ